MELDLIMGRAMPKIALTALPTQTVQSMTEEDIPDFSALLSTEKPDESVTPDAPPVPALTPEIVPQTLAPALQEKAAEITETLTPDPNVSPELEARVSPDLAAKIMPDGKEVTAQAIPNIPVADAPPKADPPSENQPVQTRAAEIFAINSLVAPAQPEPATKAAELAPILPNTPVKRMQADPVQSRDIEAKLLRQGAPDSTPTAKAQIPPMPLGNQAIAQPAPIPPAPPAPIPLTPIQVEPKISLPAQTPVKIVAQTPDQPAPAIGFTNVETITDDPVDIQFGIKIERQAVETVQIVRATAPAAPVATQITAQLPQMLAKVDKQTVELRLDPPELGRVTIHLTTNDQQVTAQVIADRPDTVDLMRRHAELLTATLARAGFSQADLSFQQGQGQHQKNEFEQFQGFTGISESDEPALATPTLTGLDGRLDIRL